MQKVFAARSGSGCAVQFLLLLLLIVFFILALWPGSESGGTPTPTPASPVAVPAGAPVPCDPSIAVGKTIRVVYPQVRMRTSPGYAAKDDAQDSIHFMQTGDVIVVKGGPQNRDGLCWWFVEHNGFQGWAADHTHEGRQLLSGSE